MIFLQVLGDFLVVLWLLWIVDRHFAHEKVAWIPIGRLAQRLHVEVVPAFAGWALIHHVAVSKQKQTVTEGEGLGAGLVDRAHDGLAFFASQLLQGSYDLHSRKAVEARRRFIEEHALGVRDQLNANGRAFALAARDELLEYRSDLSVGAMRKA